VEKSLGPPLECICWGLNHLSLKGESQRGTLISKRRNSVSVIEHWSPGTVAINLYHLFLITWLREKERQRHCSTLTC
jgi:hypothetical protein